MIQDPILIDIDELDNYVVYVIDFLLPEYENRLEALRISDASLFTQDVINNYSESKLCYRFLSENKLLQFLNHERWLNSMRDREDAVPEGEVRKRALIRCFEDCVRYIHQLITDSRSEMARLMNLYKQKNALLPTVRNQNVRDHPSSGGGGAGGENGGPSALQGMGMPQKQSLRRVNLANATGAVIDKLGLAKYDAKTAEFIKKHGSEDIESLVVRRAPIQSGIHIALNAVSMGTWDATRNDLGYDKFYHLALIVNGRYAIQRLGRVSVALKDADTPGTEYMNVPLPPSSEPLTIKQMLQTTLQRVGPDVFFKYDAFRNNCQNFTFNVLVANGLMNPQLQQFILQPLDELLKRQPDYLSAVANTVTNIGHIFGLGKPTSDAPRGLHHAFSEDDIRKFCGNIPIMRYPELANMTSPDELFKGSVGAALLFLTEGSSDGHWIAVLNKPDHYEVFDSFGTAIDGDRRWLDKKTRMEFGETAPLLSTLLGNGEKRVIHNTHKFQADDADTCGRYVAARIAQADMPLSEFSKRLTADGRSPDVNVTLMTE